MRHLFAKFGWILILRGILGVALGVLAAIWIVQIERPGLDTFGLLLFLKQAAIAEMVILLLAAYVLIDGAFALALGFQNYGEGRHWWSLILEGFLGLGLAAWVFWVPRSSIWILYVWVAVWAVFTGLLEMIQAFDLREYKDRRRPYFLAGLTSMLFGLLLVLYSDQTGEVLVWILGGYALIFGSLLLYLGIRLWLFSGHWHQRKAGSPMGITPGGRS